MTPATAIPPSQALRSLSRGISGSCASTLAGESPLGEGSNVSGNGPITEHGDDRAQETLILAPIVLREIVRLIEAGQPETARETALAFIRALERPEGDA